MDEPLFKSFNLSLEEGFFKEEPRKALCERRTKLVSGRGETVGMLVRVFPPYSGSRYCIDTTEITFVLVAARSSSDTLFPVSDWPLCVQVMLPLMPHPELRHSMSNEEVQGIGTGLLYLDGGDAATWVARDR